MIGAASSAAEQEQPCAARGNPPSDLSHTNPDTPCAHGITPLAMPGRL